MNKDKVKPHESRVVRIPALQIPIVNDCFIMYGLCKHALDKNLYPTKPETQAKLKIMTGAFEQIFEAHHFTKQEYEAFFIGEQNEDEEPISEIEEAGEGNTGEAGEGSTGEAGEGTGRI